MNKYDIFLKVAELKSISQAAEILDYTQSGVSRAIASLEEEVGFSLFIRSPSGVALTSGGQQLIDPVQRLVNQQHNFEQTVAEIHKIIRGTLRIGTFASVSICWLPKLLKIFHEANPQVEFKLEESNDYREIESWVQKGRVDCGFSVAPALSGLDCYMLMEEPEYVMMPQGHPLEEKETITLEDLTAYPFVSGEDSQDEIITVLQPIKKRMQLRLSMKNDTAILRMVENGFGITIVPELFFKGLSHNLVARSLTPPLFRTLILTTLPKYSTTAVTKTFVRFIQGVDFHAL